MAQRAINWDIAPDSDLPPDSDIQAPIVLPISRPRATRHVGVIKAYAPAKVYGLVASAGTADAIFIIDDVAPCDRARLDRGQAVTFEVVEGPEGHTAKQIRIDATTLPPPPGEALLSKGWR